MHAIVMEAVKEPKPSREWSPAAEEPAPHPAMAALHELARDGALEDECHYDTENPRAMNALVWLKGGTAVVLPDEVVKREARWTRMQRALRTFSMVAVDLLGTPLRNPVRLRDVDGLAES
jgi:hypothetical protein